MNQNEDLARNYLTPPANSFWKWTDSGEVVAWSSGGATIAFRKELEQILASQVSLGLPDLGPLFLLLAATRETWPDRFVEVLLEGPQAPWPEHVTDDQVSYIMESLASIHNLDNNLRTTVAAKITLVETVFGEKRTKGLASAAANSVIEILRQGLDETITSPFGENPEAYFETLVLNSAEILPVPQPLFQDLLKLECGLKEVTADRLRTRRQTGLDEMLLAPELEVEVPASKKIRSLLVELQDDTELGGVTRIAKTLMAAVSLPRRVELEQDISSGGVSDISNRGPLDRLLLTELANDDLTLAVRVAVNEALYLRRESPPESPPQHRLVILDCGIHSWGTPRVFGTAVVLAMIANSQSTSSFTVVSPDDKSLEDVDLLSREGLLAHLARLNPDLHPGEAIAAIEQNMTDQEIDCEPVFVTTDDVMQDMDFRKLLDRSTLGNLFVATVTRQGEYTLYHRTVQGVKRLQRAVIDPEKLLPNSSTILTYTQKATYLPAIFGVSPLPLLMPHRIKSSETWRVSSTNYLAISKDRRLTLWNNAHKGPRQLAERIPPGLIWWHSTDSQDGLAYAVVGTLCENGCFLLQVDVGDMNCKQQNLDIKRGPKAICSFHDTLFAVYANQISIVDKATATVAQTLDLPQGLVWKNDRFFFHPANNTWHALSTDGFSARFEDVRVNKQHTLLTMLEVEGIEGPIGITTKGAIDYTAQNEVVLLKIQNSLSTFSKAKIVNNRYVVLEDPHEAPLAIDVLDKEPIGSSGQLWRDLDRKYSVLFSPRNVRKRFRSIFIDESGAIVLVSNKGSQLKIHLANAGKICAAPTKDRDLPQSTQKFESVKYSEADFELSAARWQDGSQAFLDSRGLLHLKSSDSSIPEVSIVLRDGHLAGWTSDGIHWGNRYYVGEIIGSEKRAFKSITSFATTCQRRSSGGVS